jgi:uncharacterized membrane protein YdfJ with MMPL/SSD domain
MIPNVAPVIILGGIMGYTGTPLDMLTMTIMPMVLGIAVDDTIHFISRIKVELERTGSYREAVLNSFRVLGKTLGMTTVILCAMFAVYTLSPMATLSRMGLYSIIGLGSALLADYTLTPLLVFVLKPLGKETREHVETRYLPRASGFLEPPAGTKSTCGAKGLTPDPIGGGGGVDNEGSADIANNAPLPGHKTPMGPRK